jgi:8-oxo-dGTP diphosphatase
MIMKALLLYILSEILKPIFSILGIIYGLITNPKNISNKLFKMAQSNDRFVNVTCEEIFNDKLIKDSNYKFGDGRETISSVIGRNKKVGTLSKNKHWWNSGVWWENFLHKLDYNHAEKAIGWRSNKTK